MAGEITKSWQGNRGTRHERGYGRHWDVIRKFALMRDKSLCVPCMRAGRDSTPATEVDHIIPKYLGGSDRLENLQSICRSCHDAKSADERARSRGARVKPTIGPDGWPTE